MTGIVKYLLYASSSDNIDEIFLSQIQLIPPQTIAMIKKDMYKTGTPFIREINSGNIFQIITGMVILPEPVYVFLNISPKPIKYKGMGK